LWHLEIANGLAMAERRRDLSAADAEDALDQILRTAASKVDTQVDLGPARDAHASARAFQLTAYDALYLELARRKRLPLATLDKGLRGSGEGRGGAIEVNGNGRGELAARAEAKNRKQKNSQAKRGFAQRPQG